MENFKSFRADYVRHGKPEYTEEEIKSGKPEGKITSEGKEEIRETLSKIADDFTPEEFAVIMTSERQRAKEAAIEGVKVLLEKGIKVQLPIKESKSLNDVKVSPQYVDELLSSSQFWMEKWTQDKDLPEGTESPEHVEKRSKRAINFLRRLSKKQNEEEKPHFILFGHEEGVRDVLEETFNIGTKKGEGPIYGEKVSINFVSEDDGKLKMNIKYGDLEGSAEFDIKTRSIKKA